MNVNPWYLAVATSEQDVDRLMMRFAWGVSPDIPKDIMMHWHCTGRITEKLYEAGADIEYVDHNGVDPMLAAQYDNDQIRIEFLKSKGIKPHRNF